ncbi:MAG: hypothetical protein QW292_08825 [Candidatus Parvarchaeota archaeon]
MISLLSKNRQYFINDPLKFMKESIEWSAFPPLLKDLYHNYIKKKEDPIFQNWKYKTFLFLREEAFKRINLINSYTLLFER